MKPIDFEQSTKVLQKPGTLSDSQCGALPVWCDGKQCVSCWKPSIKERINILFGGNVWLGVMSGKTQPPVFVAGERVFEKTPFLPVLGRLGLKWVGSYRGSVEKPCRSRQNARQAQAFVCRHCDWLGVRVSFRRFNRFCRRMSCRGNQGMVGFQRTRHG